MQLGFVSAILPDEDLESVFQIASNIGYDCVEIMCWPVGKASRRYAGVTHINVNSLDKAEIDRIHQLCHQYNVSISGLGYYANPLAETTEEANMSIAHLQKVITAAAKLKLPVVNTFVGRDHTKSVSDNWQRFKSVWTEINSLAQSTNIKIAIENCPMIFTDDEWPGGKNLATTPAIWKRMFDELASDHFGLNYDPSHMIWQHMDYIKPMTAFSEKLFHIHAKDVKIDHDRLDQVGIMAPPNEWHTPKLPGRGDIDWASFFSTLKNIGYDGPVCVEVEDREYEGSLERRIDSLKDSHQFLRQFIPKTIET